MLNRLADAGVLKALDIHFASLVARLSGDQCAETRLAVSLVSRLAADGHVCLDVADTAGKPVRNVFPDEPALTSDLVCPDCGPWLECLEKSPAVGEPGERTPLILDSSGRLYLYRYWKHETELACALRERTAGQLPLTPGLTERLKSGLGRLFPVGEKEPGDPDFQVVAAVAAVLKKFCLISGGPGTGKTWVVSRILSLLRLIDGEDLAVVLAAPTGKAAARLMESVTRDHLNDGPGTVEGMTLHRLVNRLIRTPYRKPDVIVVDEASMADLTMAARLMGLAGDTRMIWLGDKDQLASVEAGSVLGDICGPREGVGFTPSFCTALNRVAGVSLKADRDRAGPLSDSVILLKRNFRFSPESAIAVSSEAVKRGNGEEALNALKRDGESARFEGGLSELDEGLRRWVIDAYGSFVSSPGPGEALELFQHSRILCALRKGPYGVERTNRRVEHILRRSGHIDPYRKWYTGRPILVTENDYSLGLFNGDVGIIWEDPSGGLHAYFTEPRGSLRSLPTGLLPDHETVFAMTVHKSQGSEFDRVLLLLPDSDSRVLTRELVYTGITRAREEIEIWGKEDVFLRSIGRSNSRRSGLRDALWRQT